MKICLSLASDVRQDSVRVLWGDRDSKRRAQFLPTVLLVLFSGVAAVVPSFAAPLIPYQGVLSDPSGQPIADGNYDLTISIFDRATGGTALWSEIHRNVSLANGGFYVVLGSLTSLDDPDADGDFSDAVGFDEASGQRFLSFRLGSGSQQEVVPRQELLAAFHANFANEVLDESIEEAQIADGAVSTRALAPDAITTSKLAPEVRFALPVGGVVMWYGSLSLPDGFEICDGQPPSTPGATLTGNKPDLRDRLARGAPNGVTNVALSNTVGGSHTIASRTSGGTALSTNQIGTHDHTENFALNGESSTSSNGSHLHGEANRECASDEGGDGNDFALGDDNADRNCPTIGGGSHNHSLSGSINNSGSGTPHSHGISSHDNRPSSVEVFFAIRVK